MPHQGFPEPRRKINQVPYFFAVLVFSSLVAAILYSRDGLSAAGWLFGLAFGFVLQRSRFCFVAAFRDLILFRDGSMTRALIILLLVATAGITLYQYGLWNQGLPLPGPVKPFGIITMVGAFIFGVGMVLAGGCACGTLARMGEGMARFLLVMVGLVVGASMGSFHYGWWRDNFLYSSPVFLPQVLGWPVAVAVQFLVLAGLFGLTVLIERRRQL